MLTRSSLIKKIAEKNPHLSEEDVKLAVKVLINLIQKFICSKKRIEVRNFGNIQLKHHPNLVCRDPKNGNAINKLGRMQIKFKYGKELYELLNRDIKEITI